MYKNSRFIVCGGGTGGHLFPATAIISELSKKGAEIIYMGSKYGIESIKIKNQKAVFLDIKGFHRTISISNILDNLKFPFRIIKSIIRSLNIIYKYNPQLVIGTGGYSSGIPLISAIILGKKILIQEQNSYPGFTTRTLSKFAHRICIGYNSSKKYFKNNTVFSGNPIRKDLFIIDNMQAKKDLNLDNNKFTIFICGGSQGSKPINEHVIKNLDFYNNLNANIIWQCGVNNLKTISLLNLNQNIKLYDFINYMDKVYSASDLVISRSGALTLSEINYFGKASILIPYPFSAGNHQYENAIYSEKSNAAIIIEQKKLNTGLLEKKINHLKKSPNIIKEMSIAAQSLHTPNAINIIIKEIDNIIC